MVNLKMVLSRAKEFFSGRMEKSIKVSGRKVKKMVAVFGKVTKEKVTLENGKMVQFKALEFIYPKMAIDTKDNLKIRKNMAWGPKDSQMAKPMLAITKRTGLMDRDNIFG